MASDEHHRISDQWDAIATLLAQHNSPDTIALMRSMFYHGNINMCREFTGALLLSHGQAATIINSLTAEILAYSNESPSA